MGSKIKIPESCKPLFLKQRCSDISRIYQGNWLDVFSDEINELEKCVTPQSKNILDIGSGLGFVSFLLFERLGRSDLNFYLLDSATEGCPGNDTPVKELFQPKHAFYNSFELSREIIEASGLPKSNFHFVDANTWNFQTLPKMDLIYSFASWGFHYPVETYLKEVLHLAQKGSYLVLDMCVDDRAGGKWPEQTISKTFQTLPEVLELNYGHRNSQLLPEIKPNLPEDFAMPVGKRLLAGRFKWRMGEQKDLFEKDGVNIHHSASVP